MKLRTLKEKQQKNKWKLRDLRRVSALVCWRKNTSTTTYFAELLHEEKERRTIRNNGEQF